MGSVLLDPVNDFFNHSHTDHTPYRLTSPSYSHSQHTPTYQRPTRTPPRTNTDSLMSQRASSGGSSSTSATTGYAGAGVASSPAAQQQRSRPSSVVVPRSNAPPTEPSLQPVDSDAGMDAAAAISSPTRASSRPKKIKVRDLQHIQSFATEDMGAFSELRNRSRSRSRGAYDEGTQYEISEMKVEHIIEMVAGLLTKITSTNDQQHEHLHRQPPSIDNASALSAQTSSVLAFHGKNIPSITILSYLSRINKYCPTSYEVFLSLLVYFDRMTERVNAGPIQGLRHANEQVRSHDSRSSSSSSSLSSDKMEDIINTGTEEQRAVQSGQSGQQGQPEQPEQQAQPAQTATPPASGSMEKAVEQNIPGTPHSKPQGVDSPSIPSQPQIPDLYNLSHFFVVDSFNIHRLVIAGVTCASKFFSDIFYTNSRYAKVGGLPLPELNHLELQFLLLNDFRLSIPVEEIEAYGTMLVEFYAREVVAQQKAADAMQMRSSSESSVDSTSTVQPAG